MKYSEWLKNNTEITRKASEGYQYEMLYGKIISIPEIENLADEYTSVPYGVYKGKYYLIQSVVLDQISDFIRVAKIEKRSGKQFVLYAITSFLLTDPATFLTQDKIRVRYALV